MNISINTLHASQGARAVQLSAEASVPKENGTSKADFTITSKAAAPEDIVAAGIPEDALVRDDALGRLVSYAFSLPPPPSPAFG